MPAQSRAQQSLLSAGQLPRTGVTFLAISDIVDSSQSYHTPCTNTVHVEYLCFFPRIKTVKTLIFFFEINSWIKTQPFIIFSLFPISATPYALRTYCTVKDGIASAAGIICYRENNEFYVKS